MLRVCLLLGYTVMMAEFRHLPNSPLLLANLHAAADYFGID